MKEEINFPDWLKEHFKSEPQKKMTRAEKKTEHDREIMIAFCNFIRARTAEYISYIQDEGNEVGFLASHAKKACIPKDLAWECSKPFIKSRFALMMILWTPALGRISSKKPFYGCLCGYPVTIVAVLADYLAGYPVKGPQMSL